MPWTQFCPQLHLYKAGKFHLQESDWMQNLIIFYNKRKWHKYEVQNQCLLTILFPQRFLTNLQNQYLYPIRYKLEAGNTEDCWNKRWWWRFSNYLKALRNITYWIKTFSCYSIDTSMHQFIPRPKPPLNPHCDCILMVKCRQSSLIAA